MGETSIQWTATPRQDGTFAPGYTFNPWIGCYKISEACKFCYASVDTYARVSASRGLPLWGKDAHRHVTSADNWKNPRRWDREAAAAGERRKVFCASLADVFEDRDDLKEPRARLASLVGTTPSLDWLFLTKRPEHAVRLWQEACGAQTGSVPCVCGSHGRSELCGEISTATGKWASNIWIGTTVENQEMVDLRIPHLLQVPARVRFLSCEPLLERVVLPARALIHACDRCGREILWSETRPHLTCEQRGCGGTMRLAIDWIIIGGESGGQARPFGLDWARDLVQQCREAWVAPFVKQLGARPVVTGKDIDGPWSSAYTRGGRGLRDRAGGDPKEWPADLRVREFPEVRP